MRHVGRARWLACVAALLWGDGLAADRYPSRPIRLIAPFASGGTLDVMVRLVAQKLGEGLGANVVIDNRPGANGIIGTELVARATPDGYTALFTTGSFTSNVAVYRKLPYDAQRDFAPVSQVARSYGLILVVHPDVPARSVKELITLAKAQPGKLSFASSGVGNLTHLTGEYLKVVAGIDLAHVPYKGSAPAMNDVLGKRVDMTFVSTVFVQPFIKAGRVQPIALTGATRTPVLPDVPTFKESGYPDFDLTGWYGLWFTGGTPRQIVQRTHAEAAKFITTADAKKRLDELGLVAVGSTPEEFSRFIAEDIALNKSIVARVGLPQQ
ncbi:MAG: tripartite tricarboxylate transporter substrate binding protein [Burkholderiales bacterium]|nr:tripartite tricarboxylate transporter substrate binding protein [Burkholderiales bacterium]